MICDISTIDFMKLSSGDILSLQVYKFIGNKSGKKVYIQANLHGAEIVGNAVIHQLIEYFSSLNKEQINGEIWLVPVCNPLGVNQRSHFFSTGRFNSYDGKNWNRIFWDYERECQDLKEFAMSQINCSSEEIRSNFLRKIQTAWQEEKAKIRNYRSAPVSKQYRDRLQSLCLDANYVIDIHSSSNQAIDYTFCFRERQDKAKYFLLKYGILMNNYDGDAFDEAFLKPWLALEKELALLGKKIKFDVESWTLELGSGMTINPVSVDRGFRGIKNYLIYKNVLNIDESLSAVDIKLINKDKIISYYAPTGGTIRSRLPLETRVSKGDCIYQILSFNKQQKAPKIVTVCSETDGMVFDISTNQCVNQGEYVMDILDC